MATRPPSGHYLGDENEDPYQERRAPPREIYSDLTTAVNTIKSGTRRGSYQHVRNNERADGGSIPLQDLIPIEDGDDQSRAARPSQQVAFETETASTRSLDEDRQRHAIDQDTQGKPSSLATISSAFARGSSSDVAPHRPRNPSKGPWSKIRDSGAQPSVQEGSTIVNIIKNYNGSDYESVGLGHHSRPPASYDPHLSEVTDDSSCFREDDQYRGQLLTQPRTGLPRSNGHNDLSSVGSHSAENLDFAPSDDGSWYDSSRSINPVDAPKFAPNDVNNRYARQPLAEALKPLRQPSSIYSTESSITALAPTSAYRSKAVDRTRGQMPTSTSEAMSIDEDTRRLAIPYLNYYDQQAADQKSNQQKSNGNLREPMERPIHSEPSHKRVLAKAQSGYSIETNDQEEWETVASENEYGGNYQRESSFPRRLRSKKGQRRHGIGQTGSSCADNSDGDDGFSEMDRQMEMNGFSSTDRIIQHPGEAQYRSDYGRLDLKNQKVPIMAPKYVGHKVNGYPADSMRTRQPQPYTTPSPLSTSHQNPFNTEPPEVMRSPTARQPTGMPKQRKANNHVYLGAQESSSTTDTSSSRYAPSKSKPSSSRIPRQLLKAIKSPFSTQDSLFVENTGGNPSDNNMQWDYTSSFANSCAIPGTKEHSVKVGILSKESCRVGMPGSEVYENSRSSGDGVRKVHLHASKDKEMRTCRDKEGKSTLNQNDFAYRSPLAAPQRQSNRDLYTNSELERFGGIKLPPRAALRQSQVARAVEDYERDAERHAEFQGLRYNSQQYHEELKMRTRKYAAIVLIACFVTPGLQPLLPFFALGYLDAFLWRFTHQEIRAFSPGQKKFAAILCGILLLVVIGVLAGLFSKVRREVVAQ